MEKIGFSDSSELNLLISRAFVYSFKFKFEFVNLGFMESYIARSFPWSTQFLVVYSRKVCVNHIDF